MRASRQPGASASCVSTRPISGTCSRAGRSRSLRRVRSSAASAGASCGDSSMGFAVENAPRRAAKTGPVGTGTPGLTSSTAQGGSGGGMVSASPMPATRAAREPRQTGTSAPRPSAVSCRTPACSAPSRHSLARPRSTAAASAEPPPRPAATGMRLSSAIRTPAGRPSLSAIAIAARTARLSAPSKASGERPCHGEVEGFRRRNLQRVGERREGDEAVQLVIAVGAAAGHVEIEVELGRRPDPDRHGHPSPRRPPPPRRRGRSRACASPVGRARPRAPG